jgi:DNA phosphorothioation-associated putative methyltransferase
MQALSDPQPEVQRHRAAIRRSDFSLPVKCVLRDSLLDPDDWVFDYGCGHGDDLRHLQGLGFHCDGWDPVHRPDVPRRPADAVNLGYVLNVIEDLQERAETLRDAWQLCRKVLVVAARISVGDGGEFGAEYGDGVLTRLGTFQKIRELHAGLRKCGRLSVSTGRSRGS